MALEFKCGYCGSNIVSKFLNIGEEIKCKSCNNVSIIPKSASGASEAQIKSGNTISDTFDKDLKPLVNSSKKLESLKTEAASVEKNKKSKKSSIESKKDLIKIDNIKKTKGDKKMQLYEYKVKYLKANVSQADIDAGKSGNMIAEQLETTLNDMTNSGYEYYGSTNVTVGISQGCMAGTNAPKSSNISVDIFRKEK